MNIRDQKQTQYRHHYITQLIIFKTIRYEDIEEGCQMNFVYQCQAESTIPTAKFKLSLQIF